MSNLFLLLSIISIICLIVGLIKPSAFSRFVKIDTTKERVGLIFGLSTVVFFILFIILSDNLKLQEQTINTSPVATNSKITQTETQKIANTNVGCSVSNPTISYSLLEESTRPSDVQSITIKECYILLNKKAPAIAELVQLATVLGKNNKNIEFKFFDDPKSYRLYKKYVTTHKEEAASEGDWKFLYDHFLAWYLKASTNLNNNYMQPVGNMYSVKGQTSIPEIPIVN